MTNAMAVTDQKHPDHQFGIDRGPANIAVKTLLGRVRKQLSHFYHSVQELIGWGFPEENRRR